MKIDQLITVLLSVAGWFLGYVTTVRRDRLSKRRDLRIEYLIEAYRRLESVSNRTPTQQDATNLESAIADIQLLGSPQQISLAAEFAHTFAQPREATTTQLLESLRTDLRKELNLGAAADHVTHLRFEVGGQRVR